jgi:hypothetical protein
MGRSMLRPYKNKCARIRRRPLLNYRAAQKIDLAEMGRSMLRPYKNKCARIKKAAAFELSRRE